MNLGLLYYLICIVGNLNGLLVGFNAVVIILTVISGVFYCGMYDVDSGSDLKLRELAKKTFKVTSVLTLAFTLVLTFLPIKKDMLIMSGLVIGQKGASKVIEEAGEFLPQIKTIIKKELDSLTKEKE